MYRVRNSLLDLEACPISFSAYIELDQSEFAHLLRELEEMNEKEERGKRWYLMGGHDSLRIQPEHHHGFWKWLTGNVLLMRVVRKINSREMNLGDCALTRDDVGDEVESSVEPYLLEQGCVYLGMNGRMRLTQKFRRFLDENKIDLDDDS